MQIEKALRNINRSIQAKDPDVRDDQLTIEEYTKLATIIDRYVYQNYCSFDPT